MKRRRFFGFCAMGAGCMAAPTAFLRSGIVRAEQYGRSRLVHRGGDPVTAAEVATGVNYVFHYPHVSTPCFLLRLTRAPEPRELATRNGKTYRWDGGVGPDGTLVAFSAICAHKMSHPNRQVNYISFRPEITEYGAGTGVISCCAENSVYDPAEGARVLGGPAPEPLAAILLEHDAGDDTLHATGVVGGEMFHRFFSEFGDRLRFEHEVDGTDFDAFVGATTTVHRLERFTAQTMTCGVDPKSDDPGLLNRT